MVKPKEVISAEADRREEAKERKAEIRVKVRIARSRKKMLVAMKKHLSGESLTALADQSGLSRNRAKEAIEVLVESDEAEICKVIKGRNKRELDGYKLANSDGQSVDPDKMSRLKLSAWSNCFGQVTDRNAIIQMAISHTHRSVGFLSIHRVTNIPCVSWRFQFGHPV